MCERIQLGDGTTAIICGVRGRKRKLCRCGRVAVALCDWKVSERKSGTCDAPICERHSVDVTPANSHTKKHLCVFHSHAFEIWKKKHPDFEITRRGEQGNLFKGKA